MTTSFRVLETVLCRGPLGLRLIDVAAGRPATRGLSVRAQPLDDDAPPVFGRPTGAGVHAFVGLPGLARWEHPPVQPGAPESVAIPSAASSPTVRLAVTVEEAGGAFQPFGLLVDAPADDVLDVPAFPSPAREPTIGRTALRGTLRVGAPDGPPARWARVEARFDGAPSGEVYLGTADAEGRFAVFLPTPVPLRSTLTSPPAPDPTPIAERTVDVILGFAYEPTSQRFLVSRPDGRTVRLEGAVAGVTVGSLPVGERSVPELESLLAQAAVQVHDDLATAPRPTLTVPVHFAPEAVAATRGGDSFVVLAP